MQSLFSESKEESKFFIRGSEDSLESEKHKSRGEPIGNLTQQALARGHLQASLSVSRSEDPEEREADHIANQVVAFGARAPKPCPTCVAAGTQCPSCGARSMVRLKERRDVDPSPRRPANDLAQRLGTGHQLPAATRATFESRLGSDLSDVRVHTGTQADAAAGSIRAEAFTLGSDLVFAEGRYRPETPEGQLLLAHELTHVMQQRRQRRTRIDRNGDGGRLPTIGDALTVIGPFQSGEISLMGGETVTAVAEPDGDEIDVQLPIPHLHALETFRIPLANVTTGDAATEDDGPQVVITEDPPEGITPTELPPHEGTVRYIVVSGRGAEESAADWWGIVGAGSRGTVTAAGHGLGFVLAPPVRGPLTGSRGARSANAFLDALLPAEFRMRSAGPLGALEGGGLRLERYVGTDVGKNVLSEMTPRYRGPEGELLRMLEVTRSRAPDLTPSGLEKAASWLGRYGTGSRDLERVPALLRRASMEGLESLDDAERALITTVVRAHANEGLTFASPLISGTAVKGLGAVSDIPATIGGRGYLLQVELPPGAAAVDVNELLGAERLSNLVREGEVLFDPASGARIVSIRPNPTGALARGASSLRHAGPIVQGLSLGYSGYLIGTATEEERPRVIAEEAGGQAGGWLGSAAGAGFCVVAGIATGGWVLLGCAIVGGAIGGIGGSALAGAAVDNARRGGGGSSISPSFMCFAAGTPITMGDGERRPIESIRAGDIVLGHDIEGGSAMRARVLHTIAHGPQPCLHIRTVDGTSLRVTGNHPLYASDGGSSGWLEAGQLRPGSLLHQCDGRGSLRPLAVESIGVEADPLPIFNLTVDRCHDYFASGLLAHNKPP